MRVRRLLLVAALLSSVAGVAPRAVANDPPGCTRTWPLRTSCPFRFDGLPIGVSGYTEQTGGSIRVWVTPSGNPEIVLIECSGLGRCEEEIRAEEPLQEHLDGPMPGQVHGYMPRLVCNVQGQGGGEFTCVSGGGP